MCTDLPSDFLSTPLGQTLRPTIDAMFGQPTNGAAPATSHPASSVLNSAVSQATKPLAQDGGASTVTAPLQISTNPTSLKSIISRHRATAVFFTSATCAPCKIVEPIFEDLAYGKASAGVAFVKVDLGVGMGNAAASEHGVRATPTFLFFVDGEKVNTTELFLPWLMKTR